MAPNDMQNAEQAAPEATPEVAPAVVEAEQTKEKGGFVAWIRGLFGKKDKAVEAAPADAPMADAGTETPVVENTPVVSADTDAEPAVGGEDAQSETVEPTAEPTAPAVEPTPADVAPVAEAPVTEGSNTITMGEPSEDDMSPTADVAPAPEVAEVTEEPKVEETPVAPTPDTIVAPEAPAANDNGQAPAEENTQQSA